MTCGSPPATISHLPDILIRVPNSDPKKCYTRYMLTLTLLAHNGINHANQAEAAAHQTGSALSLIAVTLLLICIIVVIMRRVDKSTREMEDNDDDQPS